MLAHRIIPVILTRGRTLVKGTRFDSWRSVGVTAQAVRIHQARGCDELVLLDISATPEGRGPDLELVRELSEVCFMPISIGGGVNSLDDVRALLRAGADKVVIGTGLFTPGLLAEVSATVGAQATVVAIDVRDGIAYIEGGKKCTHWTARSAALRAQGRGAGEILLTSIDREGMMGGYDLEMIREVSQAVSIPVVAHGGCGTYEHMRQAIEAGASAVAAGSMFLFTDATPRGAADYLQAHNIEARV